MEENNQGLTTIYITRFALTRSKIIKAQAIVRSAGSAVVRYENNRDHKIVPSYAQGYWYSGDFYLTEDEARADVMKRYNEKIASVEKRYRRAMGLPQNES